MAAISLATDLGTGQPMGHALRTCYLAVGLAREAGFPTSDVLDTYYVALLRFLGCTAESSPDAALNAGDDIALYSGIAPAFMGDPFESVKWIVRHLAEGASPIARARALAAVLTDPKATERSIRAHCEVGQMLARRIGLADSVLHALGCSFERWDGKGWPNGLAGEDIPASCRVAIVARDLDLLKRVWGQDAAEKILNDRKGKAYEPRLVQAALDHGERLTAQLDAGPLWEAVLDAEPHPPAIVTDSRVNDILEAFAHFTELKSPTLHGHATGVADLVHRAAAMSGASGLDCVSLRRAALVHDLGRVAVPTGVWDKKGVLSDEQWEHVLLHPYYTERILIRCTPLAGLAEVASAHHERNDGSGYHRRVKAASLLPAARLLAAADAFHAMTEPRPHRPARSVAQAADVLRGSAASGAMDATSVAAVLDVVGEAPNRPRRLRPAGLTEREVEVLRLLATGLSNKQIANALTVSPKTVGRHIENIYGKLGVSTRAGATLAALQHGLVST